MYNFSKDKAVLWLNQVGICVIDDYLSDDECNQAIDDMERCLVEHKDKVQSFEAEGCGGDERLFKLENQSEIAKKFANDKFLKDVANSFCGYKSKVVQVVGGKLKHIKGKKTNSGGGWHVDSRGKQFKAMVYLSDVNKDNGPFMFIPNSADMNTDKRNDPRGTRYLDSVVESCNTNPFIVTAKKGTVILTDTSHIHRGSVIENGLRYSLTSYYYKDDKTQDVMKSKWGKWYL